MGPRFLWRGNMKTSQPCGNHRQLQWGHAFYGVEILISARLGAFCVLLQWGHAFYGVEMGYTLDVTGMSV